MGFVLRRLKIGGLRYGSWGKDLALVHLYKL